MSSAIGTAQGAPLHTASTSSGTWVAVGGSVCVASNLRYVNGVKPVDACNTPGAVSHVVTDVHQRYSVWHMDRHHLRQG